MFRSIALKHKKQSSQSQKQVVQGLWIGAELSAFERLSINSYLKNGFDYHLYTYGKVKYVPNGVKIIDANEIVSKDLLFTYSNGSYAAFSNLFRFALLYEKGGIWSDLDMICIKPFSFDQDFVFASEIDSNYKKLTIGAFFIQAKPKTAAMKYAYQLCLELREKVIKGEVLWGVGSYVLTETIQKYNLRLYQTSWQTFTTCNWRHIRSFLNPDYKAVAVPTRLKDVPGETVAIHLWHEMFRSQHVNKDKAYPKGSILETLKRKYL
jgi:hypothetical protein